MSKNSVVKKKTDTDKKKKKKTVWSKGDANVMRHTKFAQNFETFQVYIFLNSSYIQF